jgi:long-chain acyl-CoA synthetase
MGWCLIVGWFVALGRGGRDPLDVVGGAALTRWGVRWNNRIFIGTVFGVAMLLPRGGRLMLNLSIFVEDSARNYPDKVAVIFGPHRLTYQQVDAMANQVANALVSAGIEPGDKVALSCPNLPFFPICYYGILKAGAAVVPLSVLLTKREIVYHLDNSDAKAHICFVGSEELPMLQQAHAAFGEVAGCEHLWAITAPGEASPIEGVPTVGELIASQSPRFETIQTKADDTAVILYTSGTTGQPKGAELTHSNLVMNAMMNTKDFGTRADDIVLVVLPLFHSFGQTCQMNGTMYCGGTIVLLPRFDPAAALQAFQDENITVFAGVPTMYWQIIDCPALEDVDLEKIRSTLRLAASGGASLPVDLLHRIEETFGIPILEGYGLSETSPVATFNRADIPRKVGSIGPPGWGVEVRIVDDDMNDVPVGEPGEVVIRGHNVMKGYYKKPEANEEAFRGGWFHSGDVGKMDEDGYFYIVDRTKDMIIRGGFNVYPREVEEVLISHPEVSLVAVVGVDHEEFGEEVKAFVVLAKDATITADALKEWSKTQLAKYKYPRIIEFRDELPLGPTGKILKRELRNM